MLASMKRLCSFSNGKMKFFSASTVSKPPTLIFKNGANYLDSDVITVQQRIKNTLDSALKSSAAQISFDAQYQNLIYQHPNSPYNFYASLSEKRRCFLQTLEAFGPIDHVLKTFFFGQEVFELLYSNPHLTSFSRSAISSCKCRAINSANDMVRELDAKRFRYSKRKRPHPDSPLDQFLIEPKLHKVLGKRFGKKLPNSALSLINLLNPHTLPLSGPESSHLASDIHLSTSTYYLTHIPADWNGDFDYSLHISRVFESRARAHALRSFNKLNQCPVPARLPLVPEIEHVGSFSRSSRELALLGAFSQPPSPTPESLPDLEPI